MSNKPENRAKTPKACIVLDTNIWFENPLLQNPTGTAFLFMMRRRGALLGLPQIVEMELRRLLWRKVEKDITEIHKGYKGLEIIMGRRDDYRVPSEMDVDLRISQRLDGIKDLLERVDYTFEHAQAAIGRVISNAPPNTEQSQQFKDSMIWEAVRSLSTKYSVDFVTRDSGFFEARNPEKGVAKELESDCKAGHGIQVHSNLVTLLVDCNG